MFKIAIIGTGIMGLRHISAMADVPEFSLCALCDTNENSVKELSQKYNVPYFTDYKDIPSSVDVDAVIINLPHFLHCESTVFFLEHGIDVFVEKPMANTVEECDKMIDAAKANGRKLVVGHPRSFTPRYIKVKELANSGKLGKFYMYHELRSDNYFRDTRPEWFLDKRKSGGGISRNFGAHSMDSLFFLLGCQDVKVSGNLANFINDENIEANAQFLVSFKDGCSATVNLCGYRNIPSYTDYFFTHGEIRISDDNCVYYRTDSDWIKLEDDENSKDTFVYQLEEFCKYLKGEESISPDGEYGRAIIAALEQLQ